MVRNRKTQSVEQIIGILWDAGWHVNHKRIERLWRKEGLQVSQKITKPHNATVGNGGCMKLRPEYKNRVWSYDFVHHRLSNGKAIEMLTVIDEHSY